jgi:predicted S18 family serine protease
MIACHYVGELPAEDQRLLAASLANRLRIHLDQAADIAGYIGQISGLAAEPAKEVVAALIDAETAVQDPNSRRALLSAANTLRGRANSLATKALRKRLETLTSSENEFDQELGREFLALIDD